MVVQSVSIIVRLLLAVCGGYGVSAGLTALAAISQPVTTALPRGERVVLASILAFPIYLAILVWVFAERRLLHLSMMMAAAGAASWGMALGIARLTD